MKITCFSSFTFSYLNRACVLFASLRKFHPDWHLVALICDEPPPGFVLARDMPWDRIIWAKDLECFSESWIFKHDIVEACTAIKGPMLLQLCDDKTDFVFYLDPDIALFNNLNPVVDILNNGSQVVLTPHLTEPNWDMVPILDNDISALKTGTYNLGFVAISSENEGRRFAQWWADRLVRFCYDDMANGLFVDQRWCDQVPALFDNVHILRDPGYNVASWNLSNRLISFDVGGNLLVNNTYFLRFWHFTKLGPLGDVMTSRYARDNYEVYEVWKWYRNEVKSYTSPEIPERYWYYGKYDDKNSILKEDRLVYRNRIDIQKKYLRPFELSSEFFSRHRS